jgi:hypothetical protein
VLALFPSPLALSLPKKISGRILFTVGQFLGHCKKKVAFGGVLGGSGSASEGPRALALTTFLLAFPHRAATMSEILDDPRAGARPIVLGEANWPGTNEEARRRSAWDGHR